MSITESLVLDDGLSLVLDSVELYSSPGDSVIRYAFTDSMEWLVQHNKGTSLFIERLTDLDGYRFMASTKIIDDNSFVVELTEATSGFVDVIFNTTF